MGFQTLTHDLSKYLDDTTSGRIQLPDFQRGYKWEDERIRQLLVTVLRGHPMGAVMLLHAGNEHVRFKPRPVEGTTVAGGTQPDQLLLDGQQRLTSLTQALTGDGVVATKDSRGKLMERRYYVHVEKALADADAMDEAVISVPGDGKVKTNFDREVVLDLSTPEWEQAQKYFPLRLLYDQGEAAMWLSGLPERDLLPGFLKSIVSPATTYGIPAIELDKTTTKAAVATVFEKVNTGGLPLKVFELLTSLFAGDRDYLDRTGDDFRLNDDWQDIRASWEPYAVLGGVESTDFLQAVTLLASRERSLSTGASARPAAVTARREDVLKLSLTEYLEWRDPVRKAFIWAAGFLADRYVFRAYDVPYAKQLVPLAAIKVVLGEDATLHGAQPRLRQWFWGGILGELYGGANETRFARDVEQVPRWVKDANAPEPNTIRDTTFNESRLLSLRTRNSAAYKGIAALVLSGGARDWMEDRALDKVQHSELNVDIHHIFPKRWCDENQVDPNLRESIVNKTGISAKTNRVIGGAAPSAYLATIERRAQVGSDQLDDLLTTHLVPGALLRADDFDGFIATRREALCQLVEQAIGKNVYRDLATGEPEDDASHFETEEFDAPIEAADADVPEQEV